MAGLTGGHVLKMTFPQRGLRLHNSCPLIARGFNPFNCGHVLTRNNHHVTPAAISIGQSTYLTIYICFTVFSFSFLSFFSVPFYNSNLTLPCTFDQCFLTLGQITCLISALALVPMLMYLTQYINLFYSFFNYIYFFNLKNLVTPEPPYITVYN